MSLCVIEEQVKLKSVNLFMSLEVIWQNQQSLG